MKRLGVFGVTALSLVIATPVLAQRVQSNFGGAQANVGAANVAGRGNPNDYGDSYAYDSGVTFTAGIPLVTFNQPAPVAVDRPSGRDAAYCAERFRSYDPASGTYLGRDGLRHPCP